TGAVYLIDQDHPRACCVRPASAGRAAPAGRIGCRPGEVLLLECALNRFGPALLRLGVFQLGNGPFGRLYGDSADVLHTPEAATLLPVAAGPAWLRRRQRRTVGPVERIALAAAA
ncbi:MAG: hypothetical protein ACPL7K_07390, partial [Armatimonadota bacterium]